MGETVQIPVVLMHRITKMLAEGHLSQTWPSGEELHSKDNCKHEMDDSQGGAVEKETSESTPSLSTMASRVSSLSGNDSPNMAETESIPSTGTPVDEVVEPEAL